MIPTFRCLTDKQETNSKREQLVHSRSESLLFAIKSKYHHHVLSSIFFPRAPQFVSCYSFSQQSAGDGFSCKPLCKQNHCPTITEDVIML